MHIAFSIFSIIAGLFAVLAFIAIGKSGGEISGRSFACIALALSLITFIGGSLRRDVYRMEFERQAAEFCDVWFEAAKKGGVCQLRQMTNPHWNRATILRRKTKSIISFAIWRATKSRTTGRTASLRILRC